MLSYARNRLMNIAVNNVRSVSQTLTATRNYSAQKEETDDQFDAKWEAYFKKPDIDDWEVRKGIHELHAFDVFPEPKIVSAALEACRRINDHSLAVRYLEALKWKAASNANVIYPWLLQEIRPTLDKLGISTPEELGYDKPELGLKHVMEMKGPNDY